MKSPLSWFGCVRELLGRRLFQIFPLVLHMVPVLAAHAASGPLIENVVPISGCSGNTAEKNEKKWRGSEENKSPAKQVLVCDQDEPGEDVR